MSLLTQIFRPSGLTHGIPPFSFLQVQLVGIHDTKSRQLYPPLATCTAPTRVVLLRSCMLQHQRLK
jgi:hypothetical protein